MTGAALKVRVLPAKLHDVSPKDLAIRFGFGAAISVVAAIVSAGLGPRVGGMLLAFPAILPATLTLIEKRQSKLSAIHDDEGAVLGAAALIPFAVATYLLLGDSPGVVALGAATVTWLSVAIGLYAAVFGRSS